RAAPGGAAAGAGAARSGAGLFSSDSESASSPSPRRSPSSPAAARAAMGRAAGAGQEGGAAQLEEESLRLQSSIGDAEREFRFWEQRRDEALEQNEALQHDIEDDEQQWSFQQEDLRAEWESRSRSWRSSFERQLLEREPMRRE
ncbi:unnamed protein product, partial [Prorocentrum cordatum]